MSPHHLKNVTSSHAYEPFMMIKGALWLTEGEAATRDVLLKKVLLKFLQNSQENRVSFLIKLQARPASNCIKKETLAQAFYCEFCEILKNTFFYRTPLGDCFCRSIFRAMSNIYDGAFFFENIFFRKVI